MRRLELEERRMVASALTGMVDRLEGRVAPDVLDAYRVVAAEGLTGLQLGALKPSAPEGRWRSPTEIAGDLGTSAAMVGRVITALELKGGEHARSIINKSPHSDRTMESWLYDDEATELIRAELERRGKVPALPAPKTPDTPDLPGITH